MVGAFHQPKLVYMNMWYLSHSVRDTILDLVRLLSMVLLKTREYYNWLKDNTDRIKALDRDT